MKALLDDAFGVAWSWGDSAIYGDYLGGRLTPEAVGRVYEVGDRFVVELRFYSTGGNAVEQVALAQGLIAQLLLTIGASDVQDTDPMG
jgi:hypothetical protein